MLNSIKLLLPALIPSWRFFDTVAPSPRIEYGLLSSKEEGVEEWIEFRPRPAKLSILSMLKRMFWNPEWNETLFLVSCSERLMTNPTKHSEQEIIDRIRFDLLSNNIDLNEKRFLKFRLIFICREGDQIEKFETFTSGVVSLLKDVEV